MLDTVLDDTITARDSNKHGVLKSTANAGDTSILVVEDNAGICRLLTFYFDSVGYQSTCISDGESARHHIASTSPPSIVLLDRMLPYESGDWVLHTIRCTPQWVDVPVIVLSARTDPDEIEQVLHAGANVYLVKPFLTSDLLRIIDSLTQN